MEYFTLYNGVKIPKVGFGTYKVIDQSAQGIVETALSVGYRHLDTARMYMNEKEVGAGIAASGVARKDIFLTTKVWRDDLSYDATMASVENSLKDLGTDYLDLCLLHWPMPETDREKSTRFAASVPAENRQPFRECCVRRRQRGGIVRAGHWPYRDSRTTDDFRVERAVVRCE